MIIPALSLAQFIFLVFAVYAVPELLLHLAYTVAYFIRIVRELEPPARPRPILFALLDAFRSGDGDATEQPTAVKD